MYIMYLNDALLLFNIYDLLILNCFCHYVITRDNNGVQELRMYTVPGTSTVLFRGIRTCCTAPVTVVLLVLVHRSCAVYCLPR